MDNLTYDQREWVLQKIVEWYRIREDSGYERDPTEADVSHSSLLRLLLEGLKPHKYPPPRSYSYPNYWAVDLETVPQHVYFKEGTDFFSETIPTEVVETTDVVPGMVGIDQAGWAVLRRERRNLILQWSKDPAEWVLRPRSQEEIDKAIPFTASEKRNLRWALKRIPPEE